jgi:type II secretory pathway pseudopilin PulG
VIVGAVVGGVVLAVIAALVAWWFIRKRTKKREEEYRHAQQLASSEYRNADGRAPLVEPFMLQTQGPNVKNTGIVDQYGEISPTNTDKSLDMYPSSPSNRYAPFDPHAHSHQYYSHPGHHPRATSNSSNGFDPQQAHYPYSNPYDPYDSSAPASTSNGGYPGYETSIHDPNSSHYEPQHSNSSATDDLANPEEFEFRLPDSRGGSYNTHLPPGARPYR